MLRPFLEKSGQLYYLKRGEIKKMNLKKTLLPLPDPTDDKIIT